MAQTALILLQEEVLLKSCRYQQEYDYKEADKCSRGFGGPTWCMTEVRVLDPPCEQLLQQQRTDATACVGRS